MALQTGPTKTGAKRKRGTLAKVACEHCRKKKQACDGGRPKCSSCTTQNAGCFYEQDTREGESRYAALKRELNTSKQSFDAITQSMSFLRRIPESEAHEYLRIVLSSEDPVAALSSLKQNAISDNLFPTTINKAMPSPTGSRLLHELSVSHPSSYPTLVPKEQHKTSVAVTQLCYPTTPPLLETDIVNSASLIKQGPGRPQTHLHADSLDWSPQHDFVKPRLPVTLCDDRLRFLDISQWTDVAVSAEQAAEIISLYLQTDHPVVGFFDADLFMLDLCSGNNKFCSPFLVSCLLFWACAYNAFDSQGASLGALCLEEAKSRWQLVRHEDSFLTVAGCMLLSLGLACDSDDTLAVTMKVNGISMGKRLRLFRAIEDVEQNEATSANEYRAKAYVSWGAFNWACLHASYYNEQPALPPPPFDIPVNQVSTYIGNTFQAICKYRRIGAEVTSVYNAKTNQPIAKRVSIDFAERKFHELLRLADRHDGLGKRQIPMSHHVMVSHIWYHTTILDIFRPFLSTGVTLKTFATTNSTPNEIYEASLEQLKCLVAEYCDTQPSALYCILWHTALLYIGNAVLGAQNTSDWRLYFDLCVRSYMRLYICFRIAAGFLKSLLWIGLKNKLVTEEEASVIMDKLYARGKVLQNPLAEASQHIADFDSTSSDETLTQISTLAANLDRVTTRTNGSGEGSNEVPGA